MEEIKVFCPASVANVSCGFDVLGFCLDGIGDEMIIRKSKQKGIQIIKIDGHQLTSNPKKNVAGIAINSLLNQYQSEFGFEIEITKRIKPGSGIGSSAASSAGAVFAANKILGDPASKDDLINFAMDGEKFVTGKAIPDNVSPLIYGGFTLTRSINPIDVIKLPVPDELVAVIIHPQIEIKTVHSREVLKENVSMELAIKQWANLAGMISGLYENNYDLISKCLVDEIVEPHRSSLIPEFYNLKNKAIEAGALGCGISGSGPSVFALTKGSEVANKVAYEMKKVFTPHNIEIQCYISKINPNGVKIISSK